MCDFLNDEKRVLRNIKKVLKYTIGIAVMFYDIIYPNNSINLKK